MTKTNHWSLHYCTSRLPWKRPATEVRQKPIVASFNTFFSGFLVVFWLVYRISPCFLIGWSDYFRFRLITPNNTSTMPSSLRNKRFRGVWEQNKDRGTNGIFDVFSAVFFTSQLSCFWLSHHFSRGQNAEIPFLWLSLYPNPTETLATQARCRHLTTISRIHFVPPLLFKFSNNTEV